MANEFVVKNGLISKGNIYAVGQAVTASTFVGDLVGTASWATSASWAPGGSTSTTSSYLSGSGIINPYLDYLPSAEPSQSEGRVYYDSTEHALSSMLDGGVNLQLGQEMVLRCHNRTGVQINNGDIVTGAGTTTGHRPDIKLAIAHTVGQETTVFGMATQDIPNGQDGWVCVFGLVHGLNTNIGGWNEGDLLYLSNTVSGSLTNVEPTYPNSPFQVGFLLYKNPAQGIIGIKTDRHDADMAFSSSWAAQATNAISSSVAIQAISADFADLAQNAVTSSTALQAVSADFAYLANSAVSASTAISSSWASASLFTNSASFASSSISASFAVSASWAPDQTVTVNSASWASASISASYAYQAQTSHLVDYFVNGADQSTKVGVSDVLPTGPFAASSGAVVLGFNNGLDGPIGTSNNTANNAIVIGNNFKTNGNTALSFDNATFIGSNTTINGKFNLSSSTVLGDILFSGGGSTPFDANESIFIGKSISLSPIGASNNAVIIGNKLNLTSSIQNATIIGNSNTLTALIYGQLSTTFGFVGNLTGTSSWASNAINSGTATTASYLIGGSIAASIKTISASYTASVTDYTILYNNTASIGIYLPSTVNTGQMFNIKNASSGTFAVTVTPQSGKIDGQSTQIINTAYTNMSVQ